jgi:hypothetical protein
MAAAMLLLLLLLLLGHQAGGSDLHLPVGHSTAPAATAQTLGLGTLCWAVLLLVLTTGPTLWSTAQARHRTGPEQQACYYPVSSRSSSDRRRQI